MKKSGKFFTALILVSGSVFLFNSCGSTKVEPAPVATVQEAKFTTDWIELVQSEEDKCGYFYVTEELGQFSMIEGEFQKNSGYDGSGFGFVCGYNKALNGRLKNYIRFEINAAGEYALYSFDGTSFKDLLDETSDNTAYLVDSSTVNSGLGATNRLKITKTAGGYNFYINGTNIASGVQPMENAKDGVAVYYSVGKASEEKFPDAPVNFSYRITDSKAAEKESNTAVSDFSTAK